MRIYVVRHGETEWSSAFRHTGRTDIPLNGRGCEQMTGLVPLLQGLLNGQDFRVIASPLKRAVQSVQLAFMKIADYTSPLLAEMDFGHYEGWTREEILVVDRGWDPWTAASPRGESFADVTGRTDEFLTRELAEPAGQALVLMTHSYVGRALISSFLKLPGSVAQHLTLSPASVSVLGEVRGRRALQLLNACSPPQRALG